jgi:hypothetical protein
MSENVTTPVQAAVNPLLQRVRMPGQRFTLPSGGLFYTNGELDPSCVNGELEVQPMTMVDDLVLKTPDKILNGDGMMEVIQRCVPQVLKPWELLSKDVDYLMACLRIVSYGSLVELSHVHDGCKQEFHNQAGDLVEMERPYKVDISALLRKTIAIDPTTVDSVYVGTLSNGQVVHTKPMTFRMFINVMQLQLKDMSEVTANDSVHNLVNMLVDIIVDVDGITDKSQIAEWLSIAPPSIIKELNSKLSSTFDWGTDLTDKVPCVDCGEMMELVVPIDPLSFFS